ncbi:hypothetical protein B0H13DRAFT_2004479 [Mycena leptocephala]|nr:hypothetical protein B0H13DRAFT_2004479 [Mycena leptocephala]
MSRSWNGKMYVSSLLFPFADVEATLFGLFFSAYSQQPRPPRSQRQRARYCISGLYSARTPPPPHRSRGRAGGCEHQVRG